MKLSELLPGAPGRRFAERYSHRRRTGAAWRKPLAIAAGGVLMALGALLVLTPGPGIVVAAVGAALVASESERAARLLDRLELRLRAAWRVVRR